MATKQPPKDESADVAAQHVELSFDNRTPTTPGTVTHNTKITFKDFWEAKRVLGWCLVVYLLPINFGYELSTVGNLLAVETFLTRFGEQVDGQWVIAAQKQQILNAASTIGLFVAAFATGILSDAFGRKKVIILACVICIAGILVQYFADTILIIFGGKLISTFGFGLGHSLGPVFVAELAPVKLRGVCLALINTMIVLGQWLNALVIYATSSRPNDLAWKIPIITQIIPPSILLLVAVPFLPESPSWLIIKGRPEEAAKSFRIFNGPDFDTATAVATMTATVRQELEYEKEGSNWKACFEGSNGRRTLIICMVYIAQQFIGVNFIAGYLTYYFKLAGVNNPIGIAQAAYAIQLFGNLCSWPLIDRFGRRTLIVGGTIVMTAGLLIIGGVSTIGSKNSLKVTVAFMAIWGYVYQATLGASAYAVGGETAAPRLRQKTYAINIMVATAVSCMVLQVMPILINPDKANLGGKITFVFFGPSFLICFYLYFCLPEMKGRTFLEIQEMFQEGVPARKFRDYKCASMALDAKVDYQEEREV